MSEPCIAAFSQLLNEATHVIEYGAGGSTRFAASHDVSTITTVESDARFLSAVSRHLAHITPHVWTPLHIDLGPVTKLGYPRTLKARSAWMRYAILPWRIQPAADCVLIDGRFRLACALATAWYAKKGTRVFFDDYLLRPWYRKTEQFLRCVGQSRRAFIFEVTGERPDALRSALIRACRDPR